MLSHDGYQSLKCPAEEVYEDLFIEHIRVAKYTLCDVEYVCTLIALHALILGSFLSSTCIFIFYSSLPSL